MPDLYFACAWMIRPNIDYEELMHLAGEADCELVAIAPISISNQGFAVLTFALQAPSEQNLVDFIQKVGTEMGLTHWYGVQETYYASGTPLYLNIVSEEMRKAWVAGMNAYGQHNDALHKKLGGEA
ncbi:MAG: hypothetical protein ABI690_21610 [Chloroflexota bacterium]